MKELIFDFVNQYAVWGIWLGMVLVVFVLWSMQRQLKKLNRNISAITGKIQEYFSVIMEEEPEEPQPISTRENVREVTFQEREKLLSQKKEQSSDDEAVIHAVLQEYFS